MQKPIINLSSCSMITVMKLCRSTKINSSPGNEYRQHDVVPSFFFKYFYYLLEHEQTLLPSGLVEPTFRFSKRSFPLAPKTVQNQKEIDIRERLELA